MMRPLLVAFSVAATCFLVACGDGVCEESYAKINNGMSLKAVQNILGSGEEQDTGGFGSSSAGIVTGSTAPMKFKTYLWKDGSNQIIVEFKDGEVVNKRKVGF